MGIAEASCFTAFIDILGISDLIERNLDLAREKLSLFHDHTRMFIDSKPNGLVKGVIFSDSLILVWRDELSAVQGCADLYSMVFDANGELFKQFDPESYKYRAILLRGAISEGSLELEDDGSGQSFVIGSSLSRSAKGEALVKGARLLMLGDSALVHPLLDNQPISPKGKHAREVLWPLSSISTSSDVERARWVIGLCRLYKGDSPAVLSQFRDTLWLFLRCLQEKIVSTSTHEQVLGLVLEEASIDLQSHFWMPITLCILDTILLRPELRSSVGTLAGRWRSVLRQASLSLMDNI